MAVLVSLKVITLCVPAIFLTMELDVKKWEQEGQEVKFCISNHMCDGPSVSSDFCFIIIIFTLVVFHLKLHINANAAHL